MPSHADVPVPLTNASSMHSLSSRSAYTHPHTLTTPITNHAQLVRSGPSRSHDAVAGGGMTIATCQRHMRVRTAINNHVQQRTNRRRARRECGRRNRKARACHTSGVNSSGMNALCARVPVAYAHPLASHIALRTHTRSRKTTTTTTHDAQTCQ
jgi:hypothetical protein